MEAKPIVSMNINLNVLKLCYIPLCEQQIGKSILNTYYNVNIPSNSP